MTCVSGNVYQVETQIQINGTFVNASTGAPVDPSTINLFVEDPTGDVTEYTTPAVVKVSVGVYYYQLTVSLPGTWTYKWQGTGTVIATSPDTSFFVQASGLIT